MGELQFHIFRIHVNGGKRRSDSHRSGMQYDPYRTSGQPVLRWDDIVAPMVCKAHRMGIFEGSFGHLLIKTEMQKCLPRYLKARLTWVVKWRNLNGLFRLRGR